MMRKIKNVIKNLIWWVCKQTIYRDKNVYYKEHYNSVSVLHLILFNIFYPGRTFNRIKFRRIRFKTGWSQSKPDEYIVDYKAKDTRKTTAEALQSLESNGAVVIRNCFSKSKISRLKDNYCRELEATESDVKKNGIGWTNTLALSGILIDFWIDEFLVELMRLYLRRRPIARNYPVINICKPEIGHNELLDPWKSTYSTHWHLDHSSLIQPAVYLSDVPKDGTTTQMILGTHKLPALSIGNLSHEYVTKHNLNYVDCYGEAGSVQVHDGNVFHRLRPKAGQHREWIKFEYCSGSNILFNLHEAKSSLRRGFDIENALTSDKRKVLQGLYPLTPPKGFELNGGYLRPTKYKGI